METEKLVRIGIDKNGILVQAGDPDYKGADSEYMDILRDGGTLKTIPLSEFKKQKLYEPYKPATP